MPPPEPVEAPPRWGRLLEEHRRQTAAREAEARRARRQLPLVLVLGVTLLLSVGALFLTGLTWVALERGIRDDPSRCPVGSEISVGGWAEPDRCYVDDGNDETFPMLAAEPGPVTRTYSDVVGDGAKTLALWVVPVLALTGVVLAWQSRRPVPD